MSMLCRAKSFVSYLWQRLCSLIISMSWSRRCRKPIQPSVLWQSIACRKAAQKARRSLEVTLREKTPVHRTVIVKQKVPLKEQVLAMVLPKRTEAVLAVHQVLMAVTRVAEKVKELVFQSQIASAQARVKATAFLNRMEVIAALPKPIHASI